VRIDGIDPSYLQHKLIILVYVFNYCFENGVCPSAWRKAAIFPIPKSGMSNKHIPGNYRGLSLQSTVLKLYTSILNRHPLFLLKMHCRLFQIFKMAFDDIEHAKTIFLLFTTLYSM